MSFKAKYSGRCPACGEVIEEGETLEWEDGRAVHSDCTTFEGQVTAKPTCSKCWTEISNSGACGCDPE